MAIKIDPTETGYIENKKFDLSDLKKTWKVWNWGKHLQSIAQAGPYTVLSSSVNEKALLLATKKEIVCIERLREGYEHAGGIDVLEVKYQGWWIVVPVWSKDSQNKSAILHYFLYKNNKLRLLRITELTGVKAYAAGIARNGNNVVIAVMIDGAGNKVLFLKCDDYNGQGKYKLDNIWNAKDPDWGGYPNNISLINHNGKIYFVGLDGQTMGKFGQDLIDIYSVNLNTGDHRKRLKKEQQFHAICSGAPSFRWGGNAQIENGKVEILAVECNVQKNKDQTNSYVRYDKFELDINQTTDQLTLTPPVVQTDQITIL